MVPEETLPTYRAIAALRRQGRRMLDSRAAALLLHLPAMFAGSQAECGLLAALCADPASPLAMAPLLTSLWTLWILTRFPAVP